jgi:hypothetical protein
MSTFKQTWFKNEDPLFINDVAVRIRAGMMMFIPIFMAFTLFDAFYTPAWLVDTKTLEDTYQVNGGSKLNEPGNDASGTDLKEGVNPSTGVVIYYHLPKDESNFSIGFLIDSFSISWYCKSKLDFNISPNFWSVLELILSGWIIFIQST